jgi:hypothetical protein
MSPAASSTDLSSSTDATISPRSVSPRMDPQGRSVGTTPVQLSRLIESAQDLASTLRNLRDDVPLSARRGVTDITCAIGELYRLRNILQEMRNVYEAPRYKHRLYRIQTDTGLLCHSAQRSMDLAREIVEHASKVNKWMFWDDLAHRMGNVERMPLLTRLGCYHILTQGLLDQLEGYQVDETFVRVKDNLLGFEKQQRGSRSDNFVHPVNAYREY